MKTDPPIILILIPGFAADERDSNCLPAQQSFIKHLSRFANGYEARVFSFQYPYERKEYLWKGVSVKSFGGSNKGGLSRLLLWKRIEREIKSLSRSRKIRSILSFWTGETAVIGKKMADMLGVPFHGWLMGQDARPGNRFFRKRDLNAGELIAISDSIADQCFHSYGIRPAHVIPLGIDIDDFPALQQKRDIDILGAGSLLSLKRFDLFVNTVFKLTEEFPALKSMLVGEGPQRKHLEELITRQGMAENVVLTGEVPRSELLSLMQRTKIVLHPSSYEGFSGVCVEALYAGAHVISFCRPMSEEIQNWHIVKNEEEMNKKLEDLLNSPLIHEPVLVYSADRSAATYLQLLLAKNAG